MIGSFLTRALALVFGYAYPAYECFKTVELNKPEIEQLRFWCQYWILVAALTVFERVGDAFISWLPMYSEAKVAFLIYLWYPKTKGTTYVYETFFKPYVAKHETDIDRNLLELRTRAGDMVILYSQRVVSYGQTRFFEVLQYIASQSPSQSRPRPAQQRQQPQQPRPPVPTTTTRQPTASQQSQPLARQPSVPASPTKNPIQELPKAAGAPPSAAPSAVAQPQSSANPNPNIPSSSETASSSSASPVEPEAMQIEASKASTKDDPGAPVSQENPVEEAIRVTRARLRKRAAAGGP